MKNISQFKKQLRKEQTPAESKLWKVLRNRNMDNCKFRRQHSLLNFIVDFVCLEKKLIIELDGGHHAERKTYDDYREKKLKKEGYKIIRFWNSEILMEMERVREVIYYALQ